MKYETNYNTGIATKRAICTTSMILTHNFDILLKCHFRTTIIKCTRTHFYKLNFNPEPMSHLVAQP